MVNFSGQIKEKKSFTKDSSFVPDIGLCVKIDKSNKIFQVVGLNDKESICWVRELPLNVETHNTFALSVSQIMAQIMCPITSINENLI